MKKYNLKENLFVFAIIALALISSCGLDDGPEPFDALAQFNKELDDIDAYLEENEIEAVIDTTTIDGEIVGSYIRYVIHDIGVGDSALDSDSINIDYEGRFLSTEAVFDSNDGIVFKLNGLIPAWRIMIPFIKEGGSITFYAPSYYCYGPRGSQSIPGNATLVFDVTLNDIK